MQEARRAWMEKKSYGVVEIPADFSPQDRPRRAGRLFFYSDMSLLLRYRQYSFSLTDLQMHEVTAITARRLADGGLLTSTVGGLPGQHPGQLPRRRLSGLRIVCHAGNCSSHSPAEPSVRHHHDSGTAADRRRKNKGYDPLDYEAGTLATVLGKSLCYLMIYLPLSYYILELIPWMFSPAPHRPFPWTSCL